MKKRLSAVIELVLLMAMVVPSIAVAVPKQPSARAKGKPIFVSHPYTKKKTVKVARDFKAWGYIKTWRGRPLTSEATATIVVQKWNGRRSWETSESLASTATISATGKFKQKTNYSATLNIGTKGRYRLRTKLVWTDSAGVVRTKNSSWKYIWIKK